MRRTQLLLALLLVPAPSSAMQLRWGTGPTSLTFSENTRAVLVVQADPAESTLPASWVLQWMADSSGIQFVALDSGLTCLADTAKVDSIWGPETPADSAANAITAQFCSADAGSASIAYYLLDLVGGSKGKLKVVALNPADTTQVIESNEAAYNGGMEGVYQPVILSASSTHHLGELTVTVEGAGLEAAQGLSIASTDGSWTFPLTVTSRSSSMLTAKGTLAAPLPECTVEAMIGGTAISTAMLPADSFPPLEPQGGSSYFEASQDTTGMLAKDFAFVNAGDSWHIFYTRQYSTGYTDYENQRAIGHAVSTDRNLYTWTVVDRGAIHARDGRIWDNLHVWAPCILRKAGDITYYMFYAGVQLDTVTTQPSLETSQIQRIGVATSVDLVQWTQDPLPLYWNKKVPWSYQDSTHNVIPIGGGEFYSDAWQFRDPFVMADPDNPGRYLLYFAAIDSCARIHGSSGCSSQYVVGVARTPAGADSGNLRKWVDVGPLLRTSQSHMAADRVESPTALLRYGNYWLMYTATHPYGDQLTFALNPHPASLDTTAWTAPDSLKAITCGEHNFPSTLNHWHAPETPSFLVQQFLMAWSDDLFQGGRIQFSQIRPPDTSCPADSILLVVPDMLVAVGQQPAAGLGPVALTLAGPSPAHSTARLQLTLARPIQVHVAVYDLLGRRVRTLMDGPLPAGSRSLLWDGHAEQGALASSGIYFVRATCPGGQQIVRVPLLR